MLSRLTAKALLAGTVLTCLSLGAHAAGDPAKGEMKFSIAKQDEASFERRSGASSKEHAPGSKRQSGVQQRRASCSGNSRTL